MEFFLRQMKPVFQQRSEKERSKHARENIKFELRFQDFKGIERVVKEDEENSECHQRFLVVAHAVSLFHFKVPAEVEDCGKECDCHERIAHV